MDNKCVPIESPSSMTYVDRYHAPIRHAYKIIKSEAPETDADAALQITVKPMNDSTSEIFQMGPGVNWVSDYGEISLLSHQPSGCKGSVVPGIH